MTQPSSSWVQTGMAVLLAAAVSMAYDSASWASGKPDTLAILKKQDSLVTITKIEDLTNGTLRYRIEFSPDEDSDIFESDAAHLSELADYAYLHALYVGAYRNLSAEQNGVYPYYPLVETGLTDGTGQAVMDYYRGQFKCAHGNDEQKCVMHALAKSGRIKGYKSGFDEGADNYGSVDL